MVANRNEQLLLAEKVRSAILCVAKRAQEPITVTELCDNAAVQYHFANARPDTSYIDRLVRAFWRSGHLRRVRVSRPHQTSRYAYEHVEGTPQPPASSATCSRVPDLPPDLKLDVIKASGHIRITYHGLSIEIGIH